MTLTLTLSPHPDQAGMDDYITKPIIMPVLSEKLATHCEQWPL